MHTIPEPLIIERIEFYPVRYPTVMRFKFFEGPTSGAGRPAVVVKLTTRCGQTGWGQSVPVPRWSYETLEASVNALENYIRPVILGMDARDPDAIHAAMNREIAPSFSTGMPITKAGVDLALHDLLGKAAGVNIAELWGRPLPDALTASWTVNPRDLNEVETLVAAGWEKGYRNFNVKVAPDPIFDLELCRSVKALVPDGFLWADANGGYDFDTALSVAPKLADLGVPVLEQPLPANRLTGYQALRKQGALPILMDEGVVSPEDLAEFIALGCLDGVAMKPARCGGLLSARRQVEMLHKHNLLFLGSGLTDPDISLAASLILYGAFGLCYPAALNGPQFLGASILKTPITPTNGMLPVPKGPGLGVEIDEDALQAIAVKS